MKLFIFSLLFISLLSACKEHTSNANTASLIEALEIQDEAIHIGMDLDSIIAIRTQEGANKHNIDQLRRIKIKLEDWKNNMIIIPGVDHDHDHVGHEGHDHSGHDHGHDHSKEDVASQISAADQKKVQTEWKTAVLALRDSIK